MTALQNAAAGITARIQSMAERPHSLTVRDCCRRRQNDPCAGILLTQPKTLQNVSNARFAPNCGGSIKIGSLGQKRIDANTLVGQ